MGLGGEQRASFHGSAGTSVAARHGVAVFACAGCIFVAGCAASGPVAELGPLPNEVTVGARLTTAAQPDLRQLRNLAAAGYRTVIHIVARAALSDTEEEARILAAQGIRYERIAVDPENLSRDDQTAFSTAMTAAEFDKVLVHCELNVLASAFVAMHRLALDPRDGDAVRDDLLRLGVPRGAVLRFIVQRMSELNLAPWDL